MGAGLGDTKEMRAGDTAPQSLCLTGSLVLRLFDQRKVLLLGENDLPFKIVSGMTDAEPMGRET